MSEAIANKKPRERNMLDGHIIVWSIASVVLFVGLGLMTAGIINETAMMFIGLPAMAGAYLGSFALIGRDMNF